MYQHTPHPNIRFRTRHQRWKQLLARCCLILGIAVAIVPGMAVEAAAPPTAAFPPGVWRGVGVMSGVMGTEGVTVFDEQPLKFSFTVEIAPDGTVVDGTWEGAGVITSVVEGGEGTFDVTATGPLGGTAARLELAGSMHFSGTVNAQGYTVPVDLDVEAQGGFSASFASCTSVSGDFATEVRAAQEAAGLTTSVTGPFTAVRIAAAGDNLAPGFEEQYVELVQRADELVAMGTPPAADVVDLAQRAEEFSLNVFGSECPGGSPNLEPGKPPYNYFVKQISALLITAMANPANYSVSDIHAMVEAAVRIGAVGGGAPDVELADQVDQAFFNALDTKLSEAEAAQNQTDCGIIQLAADTLGFTELGAGALACAGGG